jgi:ABC-type multidrug transport system fused ATPase/permease subunit
MPALGNSLTNRNAATVLRDGLSRVTQGEVTVDCSALQQVDSAAVAVLLAWQRAAAARADPGIERRARPVAVAGQSLWRRWPAGPRLPPITRTITTDIEPASVAARQQLSRVAMRCHGVRPRVGVASSKAGTPASPIIPGCSSPSRPKCPDTIPRCCAANLKGVPQLKIGRPQSGPVTRHSAMKAIEITDVRKRYRNLQALKGVSFSVERGEFFGLLGPNGAGKTTLISILAGLNRADSGRVSVLATTSWTTTAWRAACWAWCRRNWCSIRSSRCARRCACSPATSA